AIDEAEALVGSATSEARGHLRVLAPPAFAVHQLAPLLPGFRARHPGIDLAVDTPGPVETVDENVDVSVVVVARAALDGSFVARRLARSQVVLCAAAAYLDRRGRPREPHDLEAHDTMLPHFMHELVLRQGVDGRTMRLKAPAAVLGTAHLELMH